MLPPLAARLSATSAPATVAMSAAARVLREAGHDVISLAIGEPDFATPPHAVEAAHAAALAGQTKYPPTDGTAALLRAVRAKFARENGVEYGANEVIVSTGAKQGIFNAFAATLDPGDEVVVPSPYWASYPLIAQLLGGVPVFVPCDESDRFRLRPERLAAALGPRSRWVVLNFPNNPSGATAPASLLRELAEVLRHHPNCWILCDEIYEHLSYGREPHASLAAVAPFLRDRILTLNGVSKSYAMTGWRIGYAGGPSRLIRAMSVIQSNSTSGASSISQAAAVAALEGPQETVGVMRADYQRRRDAVVAALRAIPGLTCAVPDGALYLYPGVGGFIGRTSAGGRPIADDAAFALALLEEQHVAVVPGDAFGMSPFIRLSIASDDRELAEACRRIALFCAGCAPSAVS
ncbi:pyridoxal phosphate-dependent aminotransferase [Rhizosaccharibacter radicis]|uniref:Aminotransferase n=1 Tax=Rhizosaccharibacter radicis TaxID=2782605 RepID=A0ABT1VX44_9PROT|nr:pyridoxal phosphate-dependent aminotransferase [Acetobacteraceae bacterium KSS12]